ncbi:MAG: FHA domain-containing protein [Clostridium sp.]|nr:FHA domain-containing protein [Clostridium sp.]
MNRLISENLIIENKDNSSLSYILKEDSLFFDIGYKVLQNQEKSGFIRCFKVSHNGRIKLIYNISGYKSLQQLISQISHESFLTVIYKIMMAVSEVKNNGFMQCENILVDFDRIFIDANNLNTYLIYLPVNNKMDNDGDIAFENELKTNIMEAVSRNKNLRSEIVLKLYNDLKSGKLSLESIIKNIMAGSNSMSGTFKNSFAPDNASKKGVFRPRGPENADYSNVETENNKNNILNALRSFRSKKSEPDGVHRSSITLCTVNAPHKVEIAINKSEFLIGSNPEMVDGAIEFNKAISRVHCKIICVDNRYYICDMGSSNGTYLNGSRLQQGVSAPIEAGDRIFLANTEFVVR